MKKAFILPSLQYGIIAITCYGLYILLTAPKKPVIVDFYDTTFLRNSPAVEKVLKQHGFFEVNYKTQDNLNINAIMIDQSDKCDVQATIISLPGFVPGRKEGMSTLYAMLKDLPYNFMFIDSRGHGKSDGQLLTFHGIKNYGVSDYLDILGAIDFIVQYNTKHGIKQNIIIHGLCSGAFHTIKAMGYLKKTNPKQYDCVKGIVVDSVWPSVADIAETVILAESKARCTQYKIPFLQPYVTGAVLAFYNYFFKDAHKKQESITDSISEIDQPILFIHAENDLFVPVHHAHSLIEKSKNPKSWFVENSAHVNNHLRHREEYTQTLQEFIQSILP